MAWVLFFSGKQSIPGMYFVGAMINLRNYSLIRLCFFPHFLDYKRIQSIAFLFPIFGVLHPYKLECGYQSCFGGIVEVFFFDQVTVL